MLHAGRGERTPADVLVPAAFNRRHFLWPPTPCRSSSGARQEWWIGNRGGGARLRCSRACTCVPPGCAARHRLGFPCHCCSRVPAPYTPCRHLQGQRRRERRLASRSVSTQPSSSQHEEQPHEGEEAVGGEEQEEQDKAGKQNSRQPRPRPPRGRQRAVSATPETAVTAMSAAGGSDGEEEAAPRQQAQQAAQQQAPPCVGMPQPQHWLQPPLPPQWALEQQLLQQAVAQQFGQVPSAPAPLLQQQHAQRPPLVPPLQGAALPPDALPVGAPTPSAPLSLAAGMLCAGSSEWAPYTLPAACSGLKKAQHGRGIVAQVRGADCCTCCAGEWGVASLLGGLKRPAAMTA